MVDKQMDVFGKESDKASKAEPKLNLHANTKQFTTIPNSTAEFCVYTYKAETETFDDIVATGFFNTAFSFLNVGDIIRVFLFDDDKQLTHYFIYAVTTVDRIEKIVNVATVSITNLTKKKN